MRVLVSGASGAIGRTVCDALLARGDEVVGLSRDPARARTSNPTVAWHAWSPVTERPPAAALERVDGVLNLVGEPINQRWNDEVKRRIRDSRERATKNLVDAIAAADPRPRVLVSQAASGFYGDRGDAILDESSAAGDDFLAGVVRDWEAAAMEAREAGTRVVVIRTGLVLDAEAGLLEQLLPPFRLGVGGPLAGGRQYMPWVHLDDIVALWLWALDNERSRDAYNGSAPNPVTNRDFSKTLGRVLGRPALAPAPKLAVVALRGREMADAVVASQRMVPRRALDEGFSFRFPELEGALRDLLKR